jgi:SPX domain protein involved in polyphosphate accumulation
MNTAIPVTSSAYLHEAQPQRRAYAPSVRPLEAQSFVRIEDKYVVPKSLIPDLVKRLDKHLSLSHVGRDTRYTEVESVYYDSDDLFVFRSHFEARDERFKLRTRRYAPNGLYDPGIHFELKSKEKGVSKKARFQIGPEDLQSLNRGGSIPLSPALQALNPTLSSKLIGERLERMNNLIREHGLRPTIRVTYVRQAYEGEGIRVTYDDSVRTEALRTIDFDRVSPKMTDGQRQAATALLTRYFGNEHVIVEVKHSGMLPKWLYSFFDSRGCVASGFSKYCFAVASRMESPIG